MCPIALAPILGLDQKAKKLNKYLLIIKIVISALNRFIEAKPMRNSAMQFWYFSIGF